MYRIKSSDMEVERLHMSNFYINYSDTISLILADENVPSFVLSAFVGNRRFLVKGSPLVRSKGSYPLKSLRAGLAYFRNWGFIVDEMCPGYVIIYWCPREDSHAA